MVFLLWLPEWTKAEINTQQLIVMFPNVYKFFNLFSKNFKNPISNTYMYMQTQRLLSLTLLMYMILHIPFPSKRWALSVIFS